MSKNKSLPSNDTLARFLALKQVVKTAEKEMETIKSQIEAAGGTFETSQFSVATSISETNRTVDCETLLLKVGIVKCTELGLIVQGTRKNLKVERKEVLAA